MNVILTKLNNEVADSVEFFHAPSVCAAVKASAEKLVIAMWEAKIDATEGALVDFIGGNVDADAERMVGEKYEVLFFANGASTYFARVVVDLTADSMFVVAA